MRSPSDGRFDAVVVVVSGGGDVDKSVADSPHPRAPLASTSHNEAISHS